MVIEKIKEFLEAREIGAAELSRCTGIDQTRLEKGLRAEKELDLAECVLICRYLKVPIERFIEEDEASAE